MQEKSENITKIIGRLSKYIEYQNINFNQIAQKIGVSNSYFSKMVKSNGSLGEDVITKILLYYDDISPMWLLTGKGNMLISQTGQNRSIPMASRIEGKGIPLIPIEAMAGFGTGESQILDYECDQYIVPIFKDAEFLIQVKGDSMYPKYNSGDIVACKKLPLNDIFFQWNKVYVLDTIQGALIKRVIRGSDKDHILAVSENTKYEAFELSLKTQVYSVAIVIGVIRLE